MPRIGELNESYVAPWFRRADPGGPMSALNLMKYCIMTSRSDFPGALPISQPERTCR